MSVKYFKTNVNCGHFGSTGDTEYWSTDSEGKGLQHEIDDIEERMIFEFTSCDTEEITKEEYERNE